MSDRPLSINCCAKVNLGLEVVGLRADGYHDLRTVLQTIDLHDTLEAAPAPAVTLTIEHAWADGSATPLAADESNLILRAARALEDRLGGRGAAFRLIKRIPAGAGMGGASSDAAGALLLLDRLHGLRLAPGELHRVAATLGMDVPFFLYGGACLALGRGDEVYPLPDARPFGLVLAYPGFGLGTAAVYREWDRLLTSRDAVAKVHGFAPWCLVLQGSAPSVGNDLEAAAVSLKPSLTDLRNLLEEAGATAVSMTGSGSVFFGLFPNAAAAERGRRRLAESGRRATAARSVGRSEWRRLLWRTRRERAPA